MYYNILIHQQSIYSLKYVLYLSCLTILYVLYLLQIYINNLYYILHKACNLYYNTLYSLFYNSSEILQYCIQFIIHVYCTIFNTNIVLVLLVRAGVYVSIVSLIHWLTVPHLC